MKDEDIDELATDLRVSLGQITRRVRAETTFPLTQAMVLGRLHREGPQTVGELAAGATVFGVVYLMATASTGPVDPTEVTHHQSRGTIVFNAGMIVFREGLEAVLIFAAVTASFRGAHAAKRRPVTLGAVTAFGA